jgi:hypothetical protein
MIISGLTFWALYQGGSISSTAIWRAGICSQPTTDVLFQWTILCDTFIQNSRWRILIHSITFAYIRILLGAMVFPVSAAFVGCYSYVTPPTFKPFLNLLAETIPRVLLNAKTIVHAWEFMKKRGTNLTECQT